MWAEKKPGVSRMVIFGSEQYVKVVAYLQKVNEKDGNTNEIQQETNF